MDSPSLGILKLEVIDFLREIVCLVPIGVNSKTPVPCIIQGKHMIPNNLLNFGIYKLALNS